MQYYMCVRIEYSADSVAEAQQIENALREQLRGVSHHNIDSVDVSVDNEEGEELE